MPTIRSEEHTSELQSLRHLVCRLLLEKKTTPVPAAEAREAEVHGQTAHARLGLAVVDDKRPVGVFFLNDPAPTEIYPLPPHGALPISCRAATARPLPPRTRCLRWRTAARRWWKPHASPAGDAATPAGARPCASARNSRCHTCSWRVPRGSRLGPPGRPADRPRCRQ